MYMDKPRVAVVGATGMVGQEMRKILEERSFPAASLKLLASERSRGKVFEFRSETVPVEVLGENSFADIDIALFSAGGSISKKFAPIAAQSGAVVIDNSSAFRMDPDVPLVIPEVNPSDALKHNGIIANPNCSTIQMVVVLCPLHLKFDITRVVVTTFQSVSGTGKEAVEELMCQVRQIENDEPVSADVYPHQIAYNALPHIDSFEENGYTREEIKMVNETRKIMGEPGFKLTATTVRIPVVVGHSESVNIEFAVPVGPGEAREVLRSAPGVEVLDNPAENIYPLAIDCAGKDPSYVGRIRQDFSRDNCLNMWIVSDNLRKGAALNAVQIAELLLN
ncbi:MAG: aspartate-semialdehyde dehydrogenase [Actinobacteria bacterium]|nr:aspartate-semialdehyde dehydrogenase [Actinomycetota bacterium]